MTIKSDDCSAGHCYNNWGMVQIVVRVTVQRVVRYERNVILPVQLGTHAARIPLLRPTLSSFWSLFYNQHIIKSQRGQTHRMYTLTDNKLRSKRTATDVGMSATLSPPPLSNLLPEHISYGQPKLLCLVCRLALVLLFVLSAFGIALRNSLLYLPGIFSVSWFVTTCVACALYIDSMKNQHSTDTGTLRRMSMGRKDGFSPFGIHASFDQLDNSTVTTKNDERCDTLSSVLHERAVAQYINTMERMSYSSLLSQFGHIPDPSSLFIGYQ